MNRKPFGNRLSMHRNGYKRIGKWVRAFLFLWVVCFTLTALRISHYAGKDETRKADVAIVLGTAIRGDEPSPVFRERINHGIQLYKSGYVRKIVFTGGKVRGNALSESSVARKYALEHGVSPADILIEETSRNTRENLRFARGLMNENHLKDALLVSDPLHMKRGMTMAEDAGILAWPSPTPSSMFRSRQAKFGFLMWETFFYLVYQVYRI